MKTKKQVQEMHLSDNKENLRVFNRFKTTVLGLEEQETPTPEAFLYRQNLMVIRYIALVVIFINTCWLATDRALRLGGSMLSTAAFLMLLISTLYSVVMIGLSLTGSKWEDRELRVSFLTYDFCNLITVTLLTLLECSVVKELEVPVHHVGIMLPSLYLFILALLPLPRKNDGILLGLLLAVGLLVPLIAYWECRRFLMHQGVFYACIAAAYVLVRSIYLKLTYKSTGVVELNRQLTISSYTDAATNTLNRRALNRYWTYLCKQEDVDRAGVLIVDVDRFKNYNDYYRHVQGDQALRLVTEAMIGVLVKDSRYLFRYGGEEFAVFLPGCTGEELLEFGKKLNRAVWDAYIPRKDGATEYDRVTITVGCALESTKDVLADTCITRADAQLYLGKSTNHRNSVVFEGRFYTA